MRTRLIVLSILIVVGLGLLIAAPLLDGSDLTSPTAVIIQQVARYLGLGMFLIGAALLALDVVSNRRKFAEALRQWRKTRPAPAPPVDPGEEPPPDAPRQPLSNVPPSFAFLRRAWNFQLLGRWLDSLVTVITILCAIGLFGSLFLIVEAAGEYDVPLVVHLVVLLVWILAYGFARFSIDLLRVLVSIEKHTRSARAEKLPLRYGFLKFSHAFFRLLALAGGAAILAPVPLLLLHRYSISFNLDAFYGFVVLNHTPRTVVVTDHPGNWAVLALAAFSLVRQDRIRSWFLEPSRRRLILALSLILLLGALAVSFLLPSPSDAQPVSFAFEVPAAPGVLASSAPALLAWGSANVPVTLGTALLGMMTSGLVFLLLLTLFAGLWVDPAEDIVRRNRSVERGLWLLLLFAMTLQIFRMPPVSTILTTVIPAVRFDMIAGAVGFLSVVLLSIAFLVAGRSPAERSAGFVLLAPVLAGAPAGLLLLSHAMRLLIPPVHVLPMLSVAIVQEASVVVLLFWAAALALVALFFWVNSWILSDLFILLPRIERNYRAMGPGSEPRIHPHRVFFTWVIRAAILATIVLTAALLYSVGTVQNWLAPLERVFHLRAEKWWMLEGFFGLLGLFVPMPSRASVFLWGSKIVLTLGVLGELARFVFDCRDHVEQAGTGVRPTRFFALKWLIRGGYLLGSLAAIGVLAFGLDLSRDAWDIALTAVVSLMLFIVITFLPAVGRSLLVIEAHVNGTHVPDLSLTSFFGVRLGSVLVRTFAILVTLLLVAAGVGTIGFGMSTRYSGYFFLGGLAEFALALGSYVVLAAPADFLILLLRIESGHRHQAETRTLA